MKPKLTINVITNIVYRYPRAKRPNPGREPTRSSTCNAWTAHQKSAPRTTRSIRSVTFDVTIVEKRTSHAN